jgi:DNA-directed RNA polymerase subunit omega
VNPNYLELAKERISNVPLLINVVSRRVRQLNQGHRPLVKPDSPQMSNMDLALKEIAEGKMSAEISFTPSRKPLEDSGAPIAL